MEAVSSAKIWRKKALDREQMKDLVQGAISATSVIRLPRSVRVLHQNVIMYRHMAAEMDVFLFAYSLSQQIIGSVVP